MQQPFTIVQLRVLAETFCAATGQTLHAISTAATSNPKLFPRLIEGYGCTAENAERASAWFAANWPAGVPWPDGVPVAAGEAA